MKDPVSGHGTGSLAGGFAFGAICCSNAMFLCSSLIRGSITGRFNVSSITSGDSLSPEAPPVSGPDQRLSSSASQHQEQGVYHGQDSGLHRETSQPSLEAVILVYGGWRNTSDDNVK